MTTKRLFFFSLPPLLLLGLSACVTNLDELGGIEDARFSAAYAVPLIDSEVELRELLGDVAEEVDFFSVDPDGLIRFRYSGDLPTIGSEVIFRRLENIGRGIVIPIGRERQGAPFSGTDDISIEELRVSGGIFFYSFPNPYRQPVNVSLTIPQATLNGEPFRVVGSLPARRGNQAAPVLENQSDPIDLTNYVISVPRDSLYLNYSITAEDGTPLAVPEETVTAFTNLKFEFFRGYLGQEIYPGGRDTVRINFFDNYLEGDILFREPTLTMRLYNTFGVPARALVRTLNVINRDGNVLPVQGAGVRDGFDFAFPTAIGDTAVTEFVFTTANSNIAEVLSARPVAVDYEINALINPDGDTSLVGFVTDSSAYRAEVDVDLPLLGNARDFTVRDTFAIDLNRRFEDITGVEFRLTTRNGLPLDVELNGTFLDSLGNPLADLTDGEFVLLAAAEVDAEGNATGTTDNTRDLVFTDERLEAIRAADRVVITLGISTAAGGVPLVRLTDRQSLQVLLGAIVRVSQP